MSTVILLCWRICAHYEHILQFKRGCVIRLKEAELTNWRIVQHLCRRNAATRWCWQKWVNNSRFKHNDSSSRPGTMKQENGAIVRLSVSAPNSSCICLAWLLTNDWEWGIYAHTDCYDAYISHLCIIKPDFSPIEHIWNMIERRFQLSWKNANLAQQLERIWQEILQGTIQELY